MKQILLFSLLILFTVFSAKTKAQCTPDIINCIDTDDPGQICPDVMPEGTVGEEYNQTVTIIPPYEADLGTGPITIIKIKIDQINNLPPGLSYESNAEEFYADTVYCVQLSGTPTTAGTYDLSIQIIPFIDYLGTPVEMPAQTDDTSITITINSANLIESINTNPFYNLTITPNPFYNLTTVSFNTSSYGNASLHIFNSLGKEIWNKTIKFKSGINNYLLDNLNFNEGMYFVMIKNDRFIQTKKLIKTQ
ncbi:MAG: T9SS type A sorting domain-containing protein [Chlorobi bacterium]|nr:T9SS type A sorting domain-containing protein [Chlorobiota bacterium]